MRRQPATWFCLQENAELFRANTTSQPWKDYVNYVDSMVLDEFEHFIRKSLNHLMDNMVVDVSYKCEIHICVYIYVYYDIINMRKVDAGIYNLWFPDERTDCHVTNEQTY